MPLPFMSMDPAMRIDRLQESSDAPGLVSVLAAWYSSRATLGGGDAGIEAFLGLSGMVCLVMLIKTNTLPDGGRTSVSLRSSSFTVRTSIRLSTTAAQACGDSDHFKCEPKLK
jgi:hypothetical protein